MSEDDSSRAATSLPRHSKGKRPQFFPSEAQDDLFAMVMTLVSEVSVLRERVDAAEMVLANHGIKMAEEIETLELDESALTRRELQRQDLLRRVFRVSQKSVDELSKDESEKGYTAVLNEIASK